MHSTTEQPPLVFTRPLRLHANGQFKNTLFHVRCPASVISLCYNYAHYHFIAVKIIIRPVAVDFGREEVCKTCALANVGEDFNNLLFIFIPFELNN
jgi:hypothetical protein